ncbi:acyl-CoA dehydrogenase family protein [Dietzia sp. NPDC055877]
MELAWGEDFDVLAEVSRSVFARYSPLEDRSNGVALAEQVAQFAELGWLGLGDPSGQDPDSASLGTIAAIFVEMGRALAATPLLELTMTRDAALAVGSEAARGLADGIASGAAAMVPVFPSASWGSTLTYSDGVLNGVAKGIDHAAFADRFMVHATGGDGAGAGESVLALVPPGPQVTVEEMANLGGHPMFAVTFDNVPVADVDVLARGGTAEDAVETAGLRASVLRAAQVHGAGLRLLDMTVLYANQRHQFGGPIGRFQAVQYLCTDLAIAAHLTGAHARSVAAVLDAGIDPQPHAGLLRRQAAEAAWTMVHSSHEVHAGIGYMVESDVHLFTDAAKRWQYDFGPSSRNDRDVTAALGHIYAGVGR